MASFEWTPVRVKAATLLADGWTHEEVAKECAISTRTVSRWVADYEFSAEVDRLSLMTGIANPAFRLRMAKRIVAQRTRKHDGFIYTERDLLDWLKFAQSETTGIKLDLTALAAAFGHDEAPVAGSGPTGSDQAE